MALNHLKNALNNMCGRFTQSFNSSALADFFELTKIPEIEPRYNIAPTQNILAIISTNQEREAKLWRWGLIPPWAKDSKIGAKLINARGETVAEKPSFRNAFRRRRCLIVADGFYEWKRNNRQKQPYYFQLKELQPFAFAGLWESWKSPAGEIINSVTIITTNANQIMLPIHQRMPVIFPQSAHDTWLDNQVFNQQKLTSLLKPYAHREMIAYPVTQEVNSVRNESSELVKEIKII